MGIFYHSVLKFARGDFGYYLVKVSPYIISGLISGMASWGERPTILVVCRRCSLSLCFHSLLWVIISASKHSGINWPFLWEGNPTELFSLTQCCSSLAVPRRLRILLGSAPVCSWCTPCCFHTPSHGAERSRSLGQSVLSQASHCQIPLTAFLCTESKVSRLWYAEQ